ncbi:MAG: isoleucine--tRNA ligase [Candidatus Micrarchaeia archaeon]
MFDFTKNEEKILLYWKEKDIPNKIRLHNKDKKPFYFLDGPPYASGNLHPGQIWVKSIKDVYVRFNRLRGFNVHDRAGYDVHGLPIENKVEKTLGITSKKDIEIKVGVENFIKYCKEYADSLIPKMTNDFLRFGSSLDFDNPYLAYKNEFIENAWDVLKKADEKGYLYSGVKPMLYCIHCGTVLAQGTLEIEYSDETDNSIFVGFKVNKELSKPKIEISENTYLLIWTTTPWTLPSNVAVAANPKELYVKVKAGDKSLIFIKSRFDAVSDLIDENLIIEAEFYGSELNGIFYINPLEVQIKKQEELRPMHKILLSEELVSSTEGSGLVHIAPGHGSEDYQLGLKNALPIFSLVNLNGVYTEEAGTYAGLKVPEEANIKIIEVLKSKGLLFGSLKIRHSYPHCWRCKEKLLFLVTKQWFFNIQKIKSKLISESRKVKWHPQEASSWMEDILSNSPDWSIARQRYWGIPIPIWQCNSCNSYTIIGSKAELESLAVNGDVVASMQNLHKPFIDEILIKCSKCKANMSRVPDVFDVWYDSGIAFKASLSEEEFSRLYPAEFILEGKDQLRGWFSTLLKISVILYGKAPFKNVIIDGMLLSEDGREMHKSLGNYISLEELLKFSSADGYRLWCSSHTQWLDLQFKKEEIRESEKKISTMYNMFNLLNEYSLMLNYMPKKIKRPSLKSIDKKEDLWILSRLNSTIKNVTNSLENYDIQVANSELSNFLLNDLSRFYIKLVKKKILYSDKKTSKSYVDLLNYILYQLNLIISPFIPFSSEYLYLNNQAALSDNKESIFLNTWPLASKNYINLDLEKEFDIVLDVVSGILSSREHSGVKLRWPLSKATVETLSDEVSKIVSVYSEIISDYTNIKDIIVKKKESISLEIKPNFSKIGPEFKDKSSAVSEALKTADPKLLNDAINTGGYYILHTSKGPVNITKDHFITIENIKNENGVEFKYGFIYVDTQIDAKLREEALVREFQRRVQMLRKELLLKKPDKIELYYNASSEFEKIINNSYKEISEYINAKKILSKLSNEDILKKEFEIEDEKLTLQIKKV